MPRIGYIIETDGDRATVSTTRRGICAACSERSSCSFESALGKDVPEKVVVRNAIGANPGDFIEFDLQGHTELKVSLLVWIVPLVGLIAGAVLGAGMHVYLSLEQDPATLLGAAIGFIIAFAVVVLCDRRVADDARLLPLVLRVVKPSSCPELSPGDRCDPCCEPPD